MGEFKCPSPPASSNEAKVEEIIAEVERRRAAARQVEGSRARRVVWAVDRCVFWLTGHWAAVLNMAVFIYVGLPFLAPILMLYGYESSARLIHLVYRPLCHQLPQRSWFLFGPQATYTLTELLSLVGQEAMPRPWSGAFIGNAQVGYKVALCQRDTAIYGAIFLAGVAYSVLRRRFAIRPLPWWAYVVFGVLPMVVDGGYQWLSYIVAALWPANQLIQPHETTPLLRVVTGALFGLATVWLAYPYVEMTMREIRDSLHQRFGWS